MTDTLQLRLKIAGTDYGQAGQGWLLAGPGHHITVGDLLRIGGADLQLEGAAGLDADIRNQSYVEWYWYNVTTNRVPANGRLFAGWVASRGTGQIRGTTQKTWTLPCQDLNLLWETLCAKADTNQGITVPAGTFAQQIEDLFAAFNTGSATKGVDASAHVLNLTGSAVLPPCVFSGINLRDMIGVIFTNARAVNPALRPTATITPDPDEGGIGADSFGSPVVWVWDLAAPPSPSVQYTTGTPDGTHFAIISDFTRRLDSPRLANWGQAIGASGRIYTSAHAGSIATYPANPYDPDGVWKRPAVRDTQHQSPTVPAQALATIGGGAVTAVAVTVAGDGYSEAPPVTFTGGGGSGAAGTAVLGGYLLRIVLTNRGSGYGTAPLVGITGGGGSGAVAVAFLDGAGHVSAVTITNRGSGYTSAPTITFTPYGSGATATATVTAGAVTSVAVTAGGSGYLTPPAVTFSGGGGTGATATATLTGGAVTAVTVTNGGTGYTGAPTVGFAVGSGAAGFGQIGGGILSVTVTAGGSGYATAPAVTFEDGVQAALDLAIGQTALPREGIPVTSRTPALPGTYAGLTLTLESGIVETVYPVTALDLDLTRPIDPIYTMQLGSRRLRLGEVDSSGDVYAAPLEGARLNPPGNWALLASNNYFDPNVGNTVLRFTFDPPTPPPGMSLERYDLHLYFDGRWYVTAYPGTSPGVIENRVNPGTGDCLAYLVAVGRAGTRLIESLPTPTLGPFTSAAAYAPDAPTGLTILARGITGSSPTNRIGAAWARIGFTAPGTAHGPHDYYLTRWAASGEPTQSNRIAGTDTSFIISGTPGVTYSTTIQTYSAPAWAGGTGSVNCTMLTLPAGDGSDARPDAPLFPYSQTAGTSVVTVDTADPFEGASAYKIVSSGADTATLTSLPFSTLAGQAWAVRSAAKKSGGSPTWAASVEWDDGGGTWALTASTLTLPALTTSWPGAYSEEQVLAPATAKFGRRVVSVTFAAALTVRVSIPLPKPAASVTDTKFLTGSTTPLNIYDILGKLRGGLYTDGSGTNTLFSTKPDTVDSGWEITSTWGDHLFVGDVGSSGGISIAPTSGKPLTLSGTGETIIVQGGTETRGSSFPGSPGAGDRHYRTDLYAWYVYDGTRWVSEEVFYLAVAQRVTFPLAAGVATVFDATIPADFGIQFARWDIDAYVLTTNSGSHYWTLAGLVDDGASGRTSIASVSTSGITHDVWRPLSTTSFSGNNYAAGAKIMFSLDTSVTGTPGSIYLSGWSIAYRRIAT